MNKQYFYDMTLATWMIVVPLIIVILLHFILTSLLFNQKMTNNALNHELTAIQTELASLQNKKTYEIELINRLQFLMELRVKNFKAIRLLTELSKENKQIVLLQRIMRQGDVVTVEGLAQSKDGLDAFVKAQREANKLYQPQMTYLNNTGWLTAFRLQMRQEK